jgi:hypothetical protein
LNGNLDDQLQAAKVRLSRAAERCLNPNDLAAPAEADAALAEVAALQATMKASRPTCAEPGCNRLVLRGGKCDKHRAPDVWGESRRVLDELQEQEAQPVSQSRDGDDAD